LVGKRRQDLTFARARFFAKNAECVIAVAGEHDVIESLKFRFALD